MKNIFEPKIQPIFQQQQQKKKPKVKKRKPLIIIKDRRRKPGSLRQRERVQKIEQPESESVLQQLPQHTVSFCEFLSIV